MVISAVERNKARKRDRGAQVCGCVQRGMAREGSGGKMICAHGALWAEGRVSAETLR